MAGTLRVGYGADTYSKAEHYITFCLRSPNAWVTEPLIRLGEDNLPRPGLAERWEIEGNVCRLYLRKNVQFQNGEIFDARAVKKALQLYAKNRADLLQIVPDSYRIIDSHTLEFRSESESIHIIGNLSHPHVAMYAPGCDPFTRPIGTGPFMFQDYQRGRYLEVTRNERYYGEKPPHEKVVYRFIPDPQTRKLALLNGEVDIIYPVTAEVLQSLPEKGDYRIVTSPVRSYIALTVNLHGNPPFDILRDKNVRQAIAYAIDRTLIAKTVYLGMGKPAKSLLTPDFYNQGEDFLQGYRLDIGKSERLLEKSGWKIGPKGVRIKNGRPLKLRIVSGWPKASEIKPMPELLQHMLSKVGIQCELVQTDDSGVYYNTYMGPGQGDLFLEMASNSTGDPTMLLFALHHSRTPWLDHGYKWAVAGKAFDAQVDKARSTTDPQEVLEGIREAQRILIDEVCAAIPIVFVPNFYLTRKEIQFMPVSNEFYTNYGYAEKTNAKP